MAKDPIKKAKMARIIFVQILVMLRMVRRSKSIKADLKQRKKPKRNTTSSC